MLPTVSWKEKEYAQQIGFPLVIRPSFTLGGTGGGFVHGKEDLDEALQRDCRHPLFMRYLLKKRCLGGRNMSWNY